MKICFLKIKTCNAIKCLKVCPKYLLLLFIVLFTQSFGVYSHLDQIHSRSVSMDYDGYWHLLRVQEIHNDGNWDNEINFRGNAPFGERIHWTHAFDIVLLGGAYIGSFFADFDSSLYWFGVVVGPLFFLLSLAALIFFGRAILGTRYGIYLPFLFAVNFSQIYIVYSVCRPDHHCLVMFLWILYCFSFLLQVYIPAVCPPIQCAWPNAVFKTTRPGCTIPWANR